jgi:hypothetical protein
VISSPTLCGKLGPHCLRITADTETSEPKLMAIGLLSLWSCLSTLRGLLPSRIESSKPRSGRSLLLQPSHSTEWFTAEQDLKVLRWAGKGRGSLSSPSPVQILALSLLHPLSDALRATPRNWTHITLGYQTVEPLESVGICPDQAAKFTGASSGSGNKEGKLLK